MRKHGPGSEANRLYWETDRSIANISETLGISRRALYELVEPESAGATCGNCGGDLVYINRSAKASSLGRCQQCGSENEVVSDVDIEESVPPYAAGWPRVEHDAAVDGAPDIRERAFKLGGVAVVGALVGVVAALLIVRRR